MQCFHTFKKDTFENQIIVLKPNFEFLLWNLTFTEIKYTSKNLSPFQLFRKHYMDSINGPKLNQIIAEIDKAWSIANKDVHVMYFKLALRLNNSIMRNLGNYNQINSLIDYEYIRHTNSGVDNGKLPGFSKMQPEKRSLDPSNVRRAFYTDSENMHVPNKYQRKNETRRQVRETITTYNDSPRNLVNGSGLIHGNLHMDNLLYKTGSTRGKKNSNDSNHLVEILLMNKALLSLLCIQQHDNNKLVKKKQGYFNCSFE
ncbi:hypothetical protein RhiirB3_428647 [Rhizophagus irregularis]|nr:hypothetical protein RhiirB3_428647 [Rhizophagus irregularis]